MQNSNKDMCFSWCCPLQELHKPISTEHKLSYLELVEQIILTNQVHLKKHYKFRSPPLCKGRGRNLGDSWLRTWANYTKSAKADTNAAHVKKKKKKKFCNLAEETLLIGLQGERKAMKCT